MGFSPRRHPLTRARSPDVIETMSGRSSLATFLPCGRMLTACEVTATGTGRGRSRTSTMHVVRDLWRDDPLRYAIAQEAVAAAGTVRADSVQVTDAILQSFPLRWEGEEVWDWNKWTWLSHVLGWLFTAAAVSVGLRSGSISLGRGRSCEALGRGQAEGE